MISPCFSNYCFQTKVSRQLVPGLYLYFFHSSSPLPSLVKIFNSFTRHRKKPSSTHLFSVIPVDSIFSEPWNFCHCLILYPGAESMKREQEAKSVNFLGFCPQFCLLEGWGQLSSFNLSDGVPGSLGLPAIMEQGFLRPLKVVESGELQRRCLVLNESQFRNRI